MDGRVTTGDGGGVRSPDERETHRGVRSFVRRTDQFRVLRASNGNVYVGPRSAFGDGRVRLDCGQA